MTNLPEDPKERKKYPITSGVLDYFPDAIAEVALVSWHGNNQHNPGQPLHWAREKSTDHEDCIGRHTLQRGTRDTDGMRHSAKRAWRSLASLQLEIENERAAEPEKPRRARPSEEGCRHRNHVCGWICERELGHTGLHVAWSDYDTGALCVGGVWDDQE